MEGTSTTLPRDIGSKRWKWMLEYASVGSLKSACCGS